ncbi:MAG: hypothetical protein WCK70_07730 [Chloroflexales bacterium]|jgi:hypothetical protein
MAKRKRQWSLLFVIILVALILGLMKIVYGGNDCDEEWSCNR